LSNFIAAVRSRKANELAAEALQGHVSTSCCHMANVSYRLGKQSRPEAIAAALWENQDLSDAFTRCRDYLRDNGVDLNATRATLGPWVDFDNDLGRFVHHSAGAANKLSQRRYRKPFVVPRII
jgi:hypothetical protein